MTEPVFWPRSTWMQVALSLMGALLLAVLVAAIMRSWIIAEALRSGAGDGQAGLGVFYGSLFAGICTAALVFPTLFFLQRRRTSWFIKKSNR
jgi:hypothetical protein